MSSRLRDSDCSYTALALAFGIALMAGGTCGAWAQEPVRPEITLDGNGVRSFLHRFGIGGAAQDLDPEVRERPPLVVPPARDLPPPGTPSTLKARNSAWPVDRDSGRRTERRPAAGDVTGSTGSAPSRQIEMVGQDNTVKPPADEPSLPTRLWRKVTGDQTNETAVFRGEPARTSLVDPPRGFRTPSPAQPYGIINRDTADTLGHAPLQTGKPDNENR
jgi:hypothetical protein